MIYRYFAFLFCLPFSVASQTLSYHLAVDQFGYLPDAPKIAVVSIPQTGFNASDTYTPGNMLQLRRESDDAVVFTASHTAWNNGNTDNISGDKARWFDFSGFTDLGEFYVFDPGSNIRSASFSIGLSMYDSLMRTAIRTFYYQRCGVAKQVAYAGSKWADPSPCHIGANQDSHCRLVTNPTLLSERDLSGGWHDAGDYNKYVNFSLAPVLDLAISVMESPLAFTADDSYGIPESNNGLPDIADELKWELDWLLRMQQDDGSVLCMVGGGSASPPSSDGNTRYYGPATTSATYSAAAMFAICSRFFNNLGSNAYSDSLKTAAINAWKWAKSHPGVVFYNSGVLGAGEQERDAYGLFTSTLCAAVYLFDITSDAEYKIWVENNYQQHHLLVWSWASMYESTSLDALLYFANLAGPSGPVASQIRNVYNASLSNANDHLAGYNNHLDPYRAYLGEGNYVWGSNSVKAREGILLYNMLTYNLNAAQHPKFREAALAYLHYLHGVNPFGLCYLTNMSGHGAERSVQEMYHTWFGDGTSWDNAQTGGKGPAPGFLTGGPNKYYNVDGCCPNNCGSAQNNALCATAGLQPPLNQPAMKSYKDWNTSWPQNSWEITEPAIYYQAAYIRLLSKFVQGTQIISANEPKREGLECSVFPNPAREYCQISLGQSVSGISIIKICSPSGQVLAERLSAEQQTHLDLANLPPGFYFIRIENNGRSCTEKLAIGK
ncbi:MAG: glycoside hydrolase family 9 protein [Saprospiraceae bacterium]|nr:glycoside hydrolase family 9 protein [Saprospiraceae bacterium]